ncbi:MAG: AraC family transcriptional regulator [Scytonematopsis contorta HA4267-MV1]|jgi:AraC-like DNA-binding protein|nr:AraC family transcriptional regulator [Scytonematopsis contorta HA4267-MV1]
MNNMSMIETFIFPSIPQLSSVFEFIKANYHQPIRLKEVAKEVGYSAAYLTDQVHRLTGKTVNNWIIEYRLAVARSLLLQTDKSANQIALNVGYQNINHFYRQFREHHKTTPQVWRKTQRSDNLIQDFQQINYPIFWAESYYSQYYLPQKENHDYLLKK